jgi:hypothetical protein
LEYRSASTPIYRPPRVQAWLQDWGNNRRIHSLAQLGKEEAEIFKLHSDTGELVMYAAHHLVNVLSAFTVMIAVDVLILVHSVEIPREMDTAGINTILLDRVTAFVGTTLFLIVILVRLFTVSLTLTNVYRFDKWSQYMASR